MLFPFLRARIITREQSDEILYALQNHDFGFRGNLTKIQMTWYELNEVNLERLLFEILPWFTNLHTLNVGSNCIESLQGIEDPIKKLDRSPSSSSSPPPQTVIPDYKLRKLTLRGNPITGKVSYNVHRKTTHDPKEVAALITFLDAFDGIYYIGGESDLGHYPSDIKHLLRINHAGREFSKEGGEKGILGSNKPVINLALWPNILEKAHSKSADIYDTDYLVNEEAKNRTKCATGPFHLVRHFCGRLLAENHCR